MVEDKTRTTEGKLPIKTLVDIGDSLHDCTASFVLAMNKPTEPFGDDEISFVCHGEHEKMVGMFKEVFANNKEFIVVVLEALAHYKLEHIFKK